MMERAENIAHAAGARRSMTALLSSIRSCCVLRVRPSKRGRASGLLLLFAFAVCCACVGASEARAQRRPRPALSERDARRAVAAMQGFEIATRAVTVREVSPQGVVPVTVRAEVKLGFRFESVGDEGAASQGAGLSGDKRWRAVEFRTGDRRWEEFDLLSEAIGAERIEPARRALESLVTEFEARLRDATDGAESVEPLTVEPLRIESLSALGSSAVAEIAIVADFILERESRSWRVRRLIIAGESSGDLAALQRTLDAGKATRARAELEEVRAALERYRGERGIYVAAEDFTGLMDHLSPLFAGRVIRFDPWSRPYLYTRTAGGYVLASAGPDGRPATADDVRLTGGR